MENLMTLCDVDRRMPASASKVILVPVTVSSSSHAALAVARTLAHETGGRLVLLHIVQLNIAGEERGIQRTRLVDELCQNAKYQLQQLADCIGDQAPTDVLIRVGRPAEAIIEAARRLEADTIVMATHGYRGVTRYFHRNTAFTVTRQAPCTIWLVLPGGPGGAANLMIVDQGSISRQAERSMFHENQNPFRSLLRVLRS